VKDTLFDVPEPEVEQLDLPPLRGSAKQEPWANDVRAKKLAEVGRLLREWQEYIRNLERTGKAEKATLERGKLREALDASETLLERDTCRFWLDRRDNTARELLAGADPKPGDTYNQSAPEDWGQ
jgi:hypothetical protein